MKVPAGGGKLERAVDEEKPSEAQVASTAYGAATDEPVFLWTSGYDLAYYHQDAIGNVTTLSDTSGIPVETYRYDVFGQPSLYDPYHLPRSASFFGNPLLFTAREYLPQASLYQYRHRSFSPSLGRFLGRFLEFDPLSFSAGDPNLLRYVGNSPTNATDPTGEKLIFSQGFDPTPLYDKLNLTDEGQDLLNYFNGPDGPDVQVCINDRNYGGYLPLTGVISWDPNSWMDFGSYGFNSPETTFFHEATHARHHRENPAQYFRDKATKLGHPYTDMEEFKTLEETNEFSSYFHETPRKSHAGPAGTHQKPKSAP